MGLIYLLAGLLLLIVGGDFLVKGAVAIAANLKISPLVIGMTVVSFGTSAPELLVSLQAAIDGNPDIAIGNVVGSNIANLTIVLGLTVVIFPILVDIQTKRIDWPVMMLASMLFYLFALDGVFEWYEGGLLFGILVVFIFRMIKSSRKNYVHSDDVVKASNVKAGGILLLGLVGLYFGSDWFVNGAVDIAESFNVSQSVIGVTVVAFGTSAPELVASCVAAYRKETDISVGNLIGSNIFNIFAVIGLTAMVKPIKVDSNLTEGSWGTLNFDVFWMLAIALLVGLMIYLGAKLGRLKGVVLIFSYVAYITLLVLSVKNVI